MSEFVRLCSDLPPKNKQLEIGGNVPQCPIAGDIILHWLRVWERILFKIAVTTYRTVNGSALAYLSAYFTRVADVPSRQRLRSASSNQLAVLPFNLSTVGKWAFDPVPGANFWNSLPLQVTYAPSLAIGLFRQRLKTFLFHVSYPDFFLNLPPASLWTLQ